jgi:hypothetical protein
LFYPPHMLAHAPGSFFNFIITCFFSHCVNSVFCDWITLIGKSNLKLFPSFSDLCIHPTCSSITWRK